MTRAWAAAVLLVMLAALLLAGPAKRVLAQSPAPSVTAYEAHAFRNIVDSGDLLVLMRIELPLGDGGAGTWCAELEDTTGCTSTPPDPADPYSLEQGKALASFYTGDLASLENQVQVHRVDHGLAGLYFGAGHGITWEDATADACVESSATVFSSTSQSCVEPNWVGDLVQATALSQLEVRLALVMQNLEAAFLEPPGTYVGPAGLVTTAGRPFALDAFRNFDRFLPGAFQTGAEQIIAAPIATPPAQTALGASLDATATAVGVTAQLENVGQAFFGLSGPTFFLFVVIIPAALFTGIIAFGISRNPIWGLIGLVSWLFIGMFVRAPTIEAVAVVLALLVVGGVFYVIRRIDA